MASTAQPVRPRALAAVSSNRRTEISVVAHGEDTARLQTLAASLQLGDRIAFVAAPGCPDSEGLRLASQRRASALVPYSAWRVRALTGVLRATTHELDVEILAAHDEDTAALLPEALRRIGSDGDRRIRIVGGRRVDASLLQRAESRGIDVTHGSLSRALSGLIRSPASEDVLVVPASAADAVVSVATSLAEVEALTPEMTHCPQRVGTRTTTLHPSALILGLASHLSGIGFSDAGRRLREAWLRTIEEGVHHRAFAHIAPYGTRLDDDEFVAAVCQRLGSAPQHIGPRRLRSEDLASAPAPVLRVV